MPRIRIREVIVAPLDARSSRVASPSLARSFGRWGYFNGTSVDDKIAIRAYEFACTSLTAVRWVSCTPSPSPPGECLRDNESELARDRQINRASVTGALERDHFDTDVPCTLIIRRYRVVVGCSKRKRNIFTLR